MRKYKIRDQIYNNARNLNVKIEPSNKKNKKIDVLRKDKKISIGDIRYNDFYSYKEENLKKSKIKQEAFNKRHDCKNKKPFTAGYYSCKILWGL